MTFEQWVSAASTLGIPAVILAALGLGAWKACRWFATEIALPVANRHITFLTTMEGMFVRLTEASNHIAEQLDHHGSELRVNGEKCDQHNKIVLAKLDDIHQIVRK